MEAPCPFCNRYTEKTAPCTRCGRLACNAGLPSHLANLRYPPKPFHPKPGHRPANYREFTP